MLADARPSLRTDGTSSPAPSVSGPLIDDTAPAPPASGLVTPLTGDVTGAPWLTAIVPGTMLGRYQIIARLGEGGMGVVLLATDPVLGRKVALKVLHHDRGDHADASRRRLLREAQGTAQLAHDNVITVHEVGTHDGRVYLAMEYVAGGTLTAWQQGKDWREIVAMYVRAGRGLLAAHDAGLVHRDVKPDNVLVGDDGRVRVTDFGLVAAVDDEAGRVSATGAIRRQDLELNVSLTRTGSIMGTPRYMAPEQHLGLAVDARADQFAFCVALYEALYHRPPFVDTSYPALLAAVLDGAVAPVPNDSAVPAAVQGAILRGLARDQADRFPSMRELLAVLSAAIESPPRPRGRAGLVAALALGGIAVAVVAIVVAGRSAPAAPVVAALVDGGVQLDAASPAIAATDASLGPPPDGLPVTAPDPIATQIATLLDPAAPVAARRAAITALARSADDRAGAALLTAARHDPDPTIRKAAARSVATYLDLIATLGPTRPPPPPRRGAGARDPGGPAGAVDDGGGADPFGDGGRAGPTAPPPPVHPEAPASAVPPWARGVAADRQAAALTRFTAANAALAAGDAAAAIAGYRRALAHWDHPAIHYNLAIALRDHGPADAIVTELRAALAHPAALGAAKTATARAQLARLTAPPP